MIEQNTFQLFRNKKNNETHNLLSIGSLLKKVLDNFKLRQKNLLNFWSNFAKTMEHQKLIFFHLILVFISFFISFFKFSLHLFVSFFISFLSNEPIAKMFRLLTDIGIFSVCAVLTQSPQKNIPGRLPERSRR